MSLPPTAEELYTAYWVDGQALPALAARYGKAVGTVHYWFKKLGVPTRSQGEERRSRVDVVTEEEIEEMARLYEAGLSSNDISAKLGRDGRLVRKFLDQRGLLRTRQAAVRLAVDLGKIRTHTLNESFFDRWSPEMAWVLGLIFGDGHVQVSEGAHTVYLAGSEQVCTAVATLIGFSGKPRKAKGSDCWVLQFASWRITDALAKYGLTGGNKARTMRMPEIPSEFRSHFVRGLWDSDGCWRVRGKSLDAHYTSASRAFLEDLHVMLVLEIGAFECAIHENKPRLNGKEFLVYQLRLRAEVSRRLASWIYADTTESTRCSRKHVAVTGVCKC